MPSDDDSSPDPFGPVALPPAGTGDRTRRRLAVEKNREDEWRHDRITAKRRHVAFVVASILLVGSVPALVYVGYSKVLHTTSGRTVNPVDDPTEPDYQANVAPTPVELVAELGDDGTLIGAVVLSLTSGSSGGSLLFLPAGTVVPTPASGGTLKAAYATGGTFAFRRAAAVVLRTGFDGVAVIDPARWAELVAPVGPLTVDNPDKLANTATAPAFPSGTIQLAADQAGAYVAARRSASESDLNRIARQQLVWEAWLSALGASKASATFPGETVSGLGRFALALAAGPRTSAVLPVAPATGSSVADAFAPKAGDVAVLVARVVPFPTSDQPGDRIRIRILDGVGATGLTTAAARVLVPAGAEVVIVGNADRFGYATTQLRPVGDGNHDAAAAMQQALGLGSVVPNAVLDDVVEVTIVVGADFAAKVGATTSTRPSASAGGTG